MERKNKLIQSAQLITDVCLEVAPGEDVLCIADDKESMEVMTLVAEESRKKGANASVVMIGLREQRYHEPPRSIVRAMVEADTVLNMVFGSLIHTNARKDACKAGVKFATVGGVTKKYLSRLNLTAEALLEVRALTEKIAQLLTSASSARLTTKAGTDLVMSLEARNGVALVPFGKRGTFCVVPHYAEAACAPIEDSVEGVAVVDGTMVGGTNFEGPVEEPFRVYFEKGRIVNISDGKDANRLKNILVKSGQEARTFAELGVNSNHKIPKQLTGTRADNAIAGNVHIGLGRNDHIGGNSKGETHLDVLVTRATLLLDGSPILENGRLKI